MEYSQRHQGYRVVGTGARLELDAHGQIAFAGLQYEAETFPNFKPRDLAALRKIARRVVPHPITGPPVRADLMIDPMGEAPARLMYYVTFLVRARGRKEGWQVSVDAVTGKLIRSETTFMFAAAGSR